MISRGLSRKRLLVYMVLVMIIMATLLFIKYRGRSVSSSGGGDEEENTPYIDAYETRYLTQLSGHLQIVDPGGHGVGEYISWLKNILLTSNSSLDGYVGEPKRFTIEYDYNASMLKSFFYKGFHRVFMCRIVFPYGFEYIISLFISIDNRSLFIIHARLYDPGEWSKLVSMFYGSKYMVVPTAIVPNTPYSWDYVLWRYYLRAKGSNIIFDGSIYPVDAVVLIDETPLLKNRHGEYIDYSEDLWASLVRSKMLWLSIRLVHSSSSSLKDIYRYAVSLGVMASVTGLNYCLVNENKHYSASVIHIMGCGSCMEYSLASAHYLTLSLAIPTVILVAEHGSEKHALTATIIPSEIPLEGYRLTNDYSGDGISDKIVKTVDTAYVSDEEFYNKYTGQGELEVKELYLRIYDPIYWSYPYQYSRNIHGIYWGGPLYLQPLPYVNTTWRIMHSIFVKTYPPGSPIEKSLFSNLYEWHIHGCRAIKPYYYMEEGIEVPVPNTSSIEPSIEVINVSLSDLYLESRCRDPLDLVLVDGFNKTFIRRLGSKSLAIEVYHRVVDIRYGYGVISSFDIKIDIKINNSLLNLVYPVFSFSQTHGFGELLFYGSTVRYAGNGLMATVYLEYSSSRALYVINDYIRGCIIINTVYGDIVVNIEILRNSNISMRVNVYTTSNPVYQG